MAWKKSTLSTLALCCTISLTPLAQAAAPTTPSSKTEKVDLNFSNADIETVVKALGEMTGRTFVVDPRVKGTFNLRTQKPVRAEVAYDLFLASLRMQGFAAVEAEGVVRIVPEAEAKFYAAPGGKPRKSGLAGEMATRIFPLRHSVAAQVLPLLRPLIGANSAISADNDANTLLITDYADNLSRMERLIVSLDAPTSEEPVLIPLRHAGANDMAQLLARMFPPPANNAIIDRLDVAVEARSNSLILKSRNRVVLARAQALLTRLDVPTSVAGNVHVIPLKNADATRVAQTLRAILTADAASTVVPAAQTSGTATSTSTPSKSPESTPGMVQADAASNALIITAPEAVFTSLQAVVEKLDVRRAQVLVEALVAEISADKAAEFGTQWLIPGGSASSNGTQGVSLFGPSSGSNFLGAAAMASTNPSALAGITQGFSVGVVHRSGGNLNLGVLARAMETQARANILATPTLMTLDNEEAKISVGTNVPFSTGSYTMSGNTASPFQTIERRDVGLVLKIKPQITEGGSIRLQVYQELSKLRKITEVSLTDVATDKRAIESTLLVDDGQIVVLGGLIQDQVEDVEDRVPVLGDIPVLGHLFRYNTRKHSKTNLMVFLRPQVIRDAKSAIAATVPRYTQTLEAQQASTPTDKTLMPKVSVPLLPSLKLDSTVGKP